MFDKGIGDLFVAGIPGNFAKLEILGSMEFAGKIVGTKVILVLGHQLCGAIKVSIDNVLIEYIASLINGIKPVVEMASDFEGEKSPQNDPYVYHVSKMNVLHTINFIK